MIEDNTAIVWFRQDLRVHDNEALTEAISSGRQVLPVYVFDIRSFGSIQSGPYPKAGAVRTQFIIDSIKDLRSSLHKIGLPLIVRIGLTEDIIFEICTEYKVHYVFCNRERTREEVLIQDSLERKLWTRGMEIRYSRGKMLYYTADLPFPVTHTPDNFNVFRKEVEFLVDIRKTLPVPAFQQNTITHIIDEGNVPNLGDFGFNQVEINSYRFSFEGGETAGMKQLENYPKINKEDKETKEVILSPYLSQGCLSPKFVYWSYYENEKHQDNSVLNKEVYLKLLKRDHYRLIGKKYGEKIFNPAGIESESDLLISSDKELFSAWKNAETGIPGIDANMSKLRQTGFLNFSERVICARFFVEELKLDWTMGASYFETALVDYDPCSNWVQWMSVGGVGIERFDQKSINFQELYKSKDEDGSYLAEWLPVLSNLPPEFRHWPSSMEEPLLKNLNFEMGKDYPMPIVAI